LKVDKLNGVEAARGVAALLVVFFHATNMLSATQYFGDKALGGLFDFGHAGVDFFFVLSGFIIFFIHHGELGQSKFVPIYWYKRFIRIFPTYWVVLLLFGIILIYSPTRDMHERLPAVIASRVVLWPHIQGPILTVAWTLSHELMFYLLFSLLFLEVKLGIAGLLIWLMFIIFNVTTNTFADYFWGGMVFRIFNLGFFFGMAVAMLVVYRPIRFARGAFWFGTLLFFTAGVTESWGPDMPVEWPPLHLAYALGASAALYGLVGLERAGQLIVPKFMMVLGKASYSIYLLHVIVIMVLQQVLLVVKPWGMLPDAFIFLAVVASAVFVAVVFSNVVEQPLLRRFRPKRNL